MVTRINERVVAETKHANGVTATRTIRYELEGKSYETMRLYSVEGVFYNSINRPASA